MSDVKIVPRTASSVSHRDNETRSYTAGREIYVSGLPGYPAVCSSPVSLSFSLARRPLIKYHFSEERCIVDRPVYTRRLRIIIREE